MVKSRVPCFIARQHVLACTARWYFMSVRHVAVVVVVVVVVYLYSASRSASNAQNVVALYNAHSNFLQHLV